MKQTLYIQGMHCVSCEMLIEDNLNDIKGVSVVSIDHKTGKSVLLLSHKNQTTKAIKAIKNLWYTVVQNNAKKSSKDVAIPSCDTNQPIKDFYRWIELIAIVAVWFAVFFILKKLNIYQYITKISDTASMWVALLMWLIASVSTCLAVTGTVVLGFSTSGENTSKQKRLLTQWSFQIGRIGGFFVFGSVLWLIGSAFQMSLTVSMILNILVGIVILYMWLQMLWFVPNITRIWFHLPKSRTKGLLNKKNSAFAPLAGALTFFLPCGFTQSMQVLAVGTGDWLQWGLIMGAFALGTFPVLFAVGMGGEYLKQHKYGIAMRAVGVLIVFFGIYSLHNARSLTAGLTSTEPTQTIENNTANQSDLSFEIVDIGHNGWNLEPKIKKLPAWGNYKIRITPSANGRGCMSTMLIPKINREVHNIRKGEPIIYNITNAQPWKYDVICSAMGMYQWSIIIE